MEHDSITLEFRDDGKRMVRVIGREKGKTEVIDWTEEPILYSALGLQMTRILVTDSTFTLKDLETVRETVKMMNELNR